MTVTEIFHRPDHAATDRIEPEAENLLRVQPRIHSAEWNQTFPEELLQHFAPGFLDRQVGAVAVSLTVCACDGTARRKCRRESGLSFAHKGRTSKMRFQSQSKNFISASAKFSGIQIESPCGAARAERGWLRSDFDIRVVRRDGFPYDAVGDFCEVAAKGLV